MKNDNHIPRIDALRALAIALVFSMHLDTAILGPMEYVWQGSWFHWADDPGFLTKLCRLTVLDGHRGVELFS